MDTNSRFMVFVFPLVLVLASCGNDSGSPYPGGVADDDAMPETGAWVEDLTEPQIAFYVRPPTDSYGSGDGSSWENAFSGLPEQRVRGALYYFSSGDFFDESLDRVENYVFDDVEDEESFIWLVKATLDDHGDDAGFEDALAQGPARLGPLAFVTGRYVIDGRSGEGTGGYGFEIDHRDCALRASDFIASPIFFPWNSETAYLWIDGVDIEDCGNHDDPTTRSQDAVYAVAGVSHIVISNSYLHDAWRNLFFLQDAYDVMLEGNVFSRAGLHHEANTIAVRNTRNVVIRRNRIVDSVNNYISLQGVRNVTIASNVMTRTLDDWDNWAGIFSQDPALNVLVAHNTFFNLEGLNIGVRFTAETENLLVINNLWAHNRCNQIMLNGEHRTNAFWDNQRVDGNEPVSLDEGVEEEGVQVFEEDPFVDSQSGDLHLAGATEPGEALDVAFVEIDLDGNPRGSDGVADRGAYEYDQ